MAFPVSASKTSSLGADHFLSLQLSVHHFEPQGWHFCLPSLPVSYLSLTSKVLVKPSAPVSGDVVAYVSVDRCLMLPGGVGLCRNYETQLDR